MEQRLAILWREEVGRGSEITRKWFERHALQIFEEEYPEEISIVNGTKMYSCQLSSGWFRGFKDRFRISYRAPTSKAQHTPIEYEQTASEFLGFVRFNSKPRNDKEIQTIGRYNPCSIFNVDQIALPFDFYGKRTYAPRGNKSVKKRVPTKSWT